ncbi:MAG TPA: zf-HC2 domain-containing protein, partial [Ktedonobacteraceae bacterium]|nr:zf-HC2 domain-containing protein [Ktedonobacteraceae bacterium]
MAQHNDRHLTTEQLSAFIDKQLAAEEQAACTAHLQTCQQCQQALAALRQTVMLLKALPQPALPRSFVLPTNLIVMPQRPATPAAV